MEKQRNTNAVEPDPEIKQEMAKASEKAAGGTERMIEELEQYTDRSPELSGGDVDAAWQKSHVGEELVGGSSPTPDQDVVEELGEAVGITYEDLEPLHTEKKLEARDQDRWELNPASVEDLGK